jgi:RNA polymerase primary sigma factor
VSQEGILVVKTLPDDIRLQELKPNAESILQAAVERGKISTYEIAHFIPKAIERDRDRMKETITWLHQLLRTKNVQLILDKDVSSHRQEFPIIKVEKKVFRKVSRKNDSLILDVDSDTLSRLDAKGSSYGRDLLTFYYSRVNSFSLLTQETETELGRRIFEENDLDARNKLVEHNLRLVRWVAQRYAWSNISFEDLIEEGNWGLIIAANKFDPRKGRFTTHAIWWIRQAILRSIQNNRATIRTPVHSQDLQQRIRKASRELIETIGREPTIQEISVYMQISIDVIERAFLDSELDVVSLDAGVSHDVDSRTIGEAIPDNRIVTQDVYIRAAEELIAARKRVDIILHDVTRVIDISERNIEIFKIFYGFDREGRRRTLEDIGKLFNITRQRVQQIIGHIWKMIFQRNGGADHRSLLSELARIEDLETIVAQATN